MSRASSAVSWAPHRGWSRWGTLWPTRGVTAKGCQSKTLLYSPPLQHSYGRTLFCCQDKEQEPHLKGKSSDFYISTDLSAQSFLFFPSSYIKGGRVEKKVASLFTVSFFFFSCLL